MLKFPHKNHPMSVPQLYRQLQAQLSQWICPQDQRHLQVFWENVAAILQAQSACLSHWLPYLSHRDCSSRSHMERLNYFVHNPKITAETFYFPRFTAVFECLGGHGDDADIGYQCVMGSILPH
jgi:hypothetical protein